MKFLEKIGNGPMTKWLNFGGDPGQHDHIYTVFQIIEVTLNFKSV